MNTHYQILQSLLDFDQPLDALKKEIKTLPWDSEEEVIILKKDHLFKILEKFTNQQLDSDELSEWANLIEGREDIGFEEKDEEILKKIIFEMANPEINEPITVSVVMRWASALK